MENTRDADARPQHFLRDRASLLNGDASAAGSASIRTMVGALRSRFLYRLLVAASLMLSCIPAMWVDPAFAWLARQIYLRDGSRPRQLRANLRVALGPTGGGDAVDAAAKDVYASYGRYMAEYLTLGWPDIWRRRNRIAPIDAKLLEDELATGRGAVLFGIHGGNWDSAAAECRRRYGEFHSIGEEVQPVWLGRFMTRMRRRGGIRLHEGSGGGRELIRALRRGNVVGLVADRMIVGKGVDAMLCGKLTHLPTGPVTLAMMTGAKLLGTAIERQPNGYLGIEILPPVDLSDLDRSPESIAIGVQRMADVLTLLIERGYRSWYALQPIWDEGSI